MKKICGIYKITNPVGKIYIGQSVDIYVTFKNRYGNCHCGTQPLIYNSIKKYGLEKHLFDIIHQCEEEELNKFEIYYSQLYNSTDKRVGLNIRECGGSRGRHSEETKKRMSYTRRKIYKENPELGKKIGERNRGKKASIEAKKKMSDAHIGKKHTPEAIIKCRIASSGRKYPGRKYTDEQNKARSIFTTGRKMSPESIEKTRQANIGKKHSDETKRKLSAYFKGKSRPIEVAKKRCKIILNLETGIFYIGAKEVSIQMGVSELSASRRLNGYLINKTPFVYV